MDEDFVIMDITTGNLEGGVFEQREDAEEWIKNQDNEFNYQIIKRD